MLLKYSILTAKRLIVSLCLTKTTFLLAKHLLIKIPLASCKADSKFYYVKVKHSGLLKSSILKAQPYARASPLLRF